MNPRRRKHLVTATFIIVGVAAATLLGLKAFQENLLYFYSPSQIAAGEAPQTRSFRAGGLVVEGSVARDSESLIARWLPVCLQASHPGETTVAVLLQTHHR
jgi:cytochrome c-type biogenesis protein CcmE